MNTELTLIDNGPEAAVSWALPVKFKKEDSRATLPAYARAGDMGLDLYGIELDKETDTFLQYKTGLSVEIPKGYGGLIFPRSSISKFDLILANSIGVIDSGYRGEILLRFKKVTRFKQLFNFAKVIRSYISGHSSKMYYDLPAVELFNLSEPIAQLIIMPYPMISPEWAEELSDTERGSGNFGHTNAGRS